MTHKILLAIVTLGLFSVGGCYLSSIGVHARYEDYGHEEADEYTPRVTEIVVVEKVKKEVETVKYKETTRTKGKPVRKSSKKTY